MGWSWGAPAGLRGRLGTRAGRILERARAGTREPQLQPAVRGLLVPLSSVFLSYPTHWSSANAARSGLAACGRRPHPQMGLGAGMAVLHDGAEGQEAAPGPRALWSGGPCHPHTMTPLSLSSLLSYLQMISARWANIRVGPLLLDLKKKKKNTLLGLGYQFWITLKLVTEQTVFTQSISKQKVGMCGFQFKNWMEAIQTSLLLSLRRTWQAAGAEWDFRAVEGTRPWNSHRYICWTLFPNKVTFTNPGVRTWKSRRRRYPRNSEWLIGMRPHDVGPRGCWIYWACLPFSFKGCCGGCVESGWNTSLPCELTPVAPWLIPAWAEMSRSPVWPHCLALPLTWTSSSCWWAFFSLTQRPYCLTCYARNVCVKILENTSNYRCIIKVKKQTSSIDAVTGVALLTFAGRTFSLLGLPTTLFHGFEDVVVNIPTSDEREATKWGNLFKVLASASLRYVALVNYFYNKSYHYTVFRTCCFP